MAWSDKKIVNEARKRFERLEKVGIESEALDILKSNINVFYNTNKGVRKTSISGISLKKSMSTQQRKEMRQIIRAFLKSDGTTINSVQRKYDKLIGQYKKSTIKPRKQSNVISIKSMSKEIRRLERLLEDRKSVSYLGSEVIKQVWEEQKEQGYDVDKVREILSEYVEQMENNENNGVEMELTSDEIAQEIIDRISKEINVYDGII